MMLNSLSSWVIELNNYLMREPVQIKLMGELIVGRADPNGDHLVDVDLTPYGAADMGVSRRHLTISVQNDILTVTDLASGNGTYLNGAHLKPNTPYPLSNEDELQLGMFKLSMRVVNSPQIMASMGERQTKIERRPNVRGNGEMILIVEDHIEVAHMFSLMLQKQGYVTHICRSVEPAIQFLRDAKPEVVLLDLMLPDVNGIEFCSYIRSIPNLQDVAIIVATALQDATVRQSVMDAGADVFLQKPIITEELIDVVSTLLEKRQPTLISKPPLLSEKEGGMDTKMLNRSIGARIMQTDISDETVVIVVGGYSDQPLRLTLNQPVSFGRSEYVGEFQHVDLSKFNAAEYGVSRVHMYMQFYDGKVYIEDSGSTNGTFLNGKRLTAEEPTLIYSGSEIRIGQLRMYVYFLDDLGI